MELRHLRYFIAVAEEQNISRAAIRLHVSQPPLSRQIRDLEDELGVSLFERTSRSVRLTAAGWAFLEECYPALQQVERAVGAARAASGKGTRRLHLGYAPGPTQALLRAVLRRLRREDPDVRIVLHDLSTQEMIAGVRRGELHAALAMAPDPAALGGLEFESIRADDPMVAVAPEHGWAKRKSIKVTDLRRASWVLFSQRDYPEHRENIARMLGVPAVQLQIAEECDSGTSLIASVEAGAGVTVVSNSLAETISGRLHLIPISPRPTPSIMGMLYSPRGRDAMVQRLLRIARDVAREQGRATSTAAR